MKKAKMIQLLKEELETERIEAEENNREEKKKVMYFKYEKDNEVFIGDSCCLFCLDRNLIPVKRSKCFLLPDSVKKHIVEEVENEELTELVFNNIYIDVDNNKMNVYRIDSEPYKVYGFLFYLNKKYCDLFSDKAVYKTKVCKNLHYRSFIYVFEKEKFVGLILQVKR